MPLNTKTRVKHERERETIGKKGCSELTVGVSILVTTESRRPFPVRVARKLVIIKSDIRCGQAKKHFRSKHRGRGIRDEV